MQPNQQQQPAPQNNMQPPALSFQPGQPTLQPAAGMAVDPSIPQPQQAPQPQPAATGADADQPQQTVGGVPMLDAGRAEAFTKNFAYLCNEAVELTGLPIDVLLGQIVKFAGIQGLPAQGHMLDFGAGSALVPTQQVMEGWTRTYFQQVMSKQRQMANNAAGGMPEA